MYSSQVDPRNPRVMLAFAGLVFALFLLAQMRLPQAGFDVTSVSATQAKALIDDGALVIDVREAGPFKSRHIPGALHVPLDAMRESIPIAIAEAKTESVVVYCGDGVKIGPEGTALLNQAGFTRQ